MDTEAVGALSVSLVGRVKHGDLIRAMQERGWNQSDLGRHLGLSPTVIGSLINLSLVPGPALMERLTPKLLELTGKLPEDLWPEWSRDKEFLDRDKRVVIGREITSRELSGRGCLALPATPEEVFSVEERRYALRTALRTLTPREERVITKRFNIDGEGEESVEKIASDFGISTARIRQIEQKALRKLRHPSRSRRLASYL